MKEDAPDLLKGVMAGIAGGLLASFLMEQFQAAWTRAAKEFRNAENEKQSREKPSTVKAADAISKKITGRMLPKKQKPLAGEAVHYAMGATSAAIYGGLAEIAPIVTATQGLGFGAGVWLLADEISVPALGLAKPPNETPLSTHVYALVSHLLYGWVTEVVRSAFRRAL